VADEKVLDIKAEIGAAGETPEMTEAERQWGKKLIAQTMGKQMADLSPDGRRFIGGYMESWQDYLLEWVEKPGVTLEQVMQRCKNISHLKPGNWVSKGAENDANSGDPNFYAGFTPAPCNEMKFKLATGFQVNTPTIPDEPEIAPTQEELEEALAAYPGNSCIDLLASGWASIRDLVNLNPWVRDDFMKSVLYADRPVSLIKKFVLTCRSASYALQWGLKYGSDLDLLKMMMKDPENGVEFSKLRDWAIWVGDREMMRIWLDDIALGQDEWETLATVLGYWPEELHESKIPFYHWRKKAIMSVDIKTNTSAFYELEKLAYEVLGDGLFFDAKEESVIESVRIYETALRKRGIFDFPKVYTHKYERERPSLD
jgi:hypothetical protein